MKLNKLDIAYGVLIFLSLIALIYLLIIRQPKIENVEVDVPVELGFGNYNLIYGGVAALSTFGLFSYFIRNNFIQNRFSKLIAIPVENAGSENYQNSIKKDANVINSDNLKWAFIVKLQDNFNYLKDKIYSTILYGYDKILFAYANNEIYNLILYGLTAVIAVLVTLTSVYLTYRLLKYVLGKLSNKIKKLAEKSKNWYSKILKLFDPKTKAINSNIIPSDNVNQSQANNKLNPLFGRILGLIGIIYKKVREVYNNLSQPTENIPAGESQGQQQGQSEGQSEGVQQQGQSEGQSEGVQQQGQSEGVQQQGQSEGFTEIPGQQEDSC